MRVVEESYEYSIFAEGMKLVTDEMMESIMAE